MKLASFRHAERERIGVTLDEQSLIDLHDAVAAMGEDRAALPVDMIALIESADDLGAMLAATVEFATANPDAIESIAVTDVQWRPPVRRPGKILGVAMNNSASDARKISAPDHPAFFLKPASCLIGHNEAIEVREKYGSVHPEPELAVVIGRHCRDVSVAAAYDVVFGYTIINDVTSNGMRAEDLFHYYALYASASESGELKRVEQHLSYAARYKGSDTFGPLGPWLVTKDEIPDPHSLEVRCWLKDELIAEDSTRYYTRGVAEVIAFITQFHSLWPGDVIAMGTAFRPAAQGRSLHQANITELGGPVSISITGLGTLSNPVRRIGDD